MTVSWWHLWHDTASDRTPLARMLPSVIGSVGSSNRHAASVAGSIGSTIEASSFSGLLTRVDIGHIRISSPEQSHQIARVGSGSRL
jgi:hypothetical protein